MAKLIVRTGCFIAFAAMGMGCGARDEARGDDPAAEVTSGVILADSDADVDAGDGTVVPDEPPTTSSVPVAVPALVCTSPNVWGVPEWTLKTTAGSPNGSVVLRRYSIVDAQTFTIALYTVTARDEETATGPERVLVDANGAFELRIDPRGDAIGHASTLVGTTIDLALDCGPAPIPAAPPTSGGGTKKPSRKK